jgi:obg-like ATPase 1
LVKIKEWVDSHDPGALVIPFSGGVESVLQDMSEEEIQKYCTEHKAQRLISIQSPHTLLSTVPSTHSFNYMR